VVSRTRLCYIIRTLPLVFYVLKVGIPNPDFGLHRGMNIYFWFWGFCTVCEVNFPTTFRKPLWVLYSLVSDTSGHLSRTPYKNQKPKINILNPVRTLRPVQNDKQHMPLMCSAQCLHPVTSPCHIQSTAVMMKRAYWC
jgi:hypothetical protein